MTNRHHAGKGLCFARLPDGSVHFELFADETCAGKPLRNEVIPWKEWCRTVAAVSARGDTETTRAEAETWHHRQYELVLAPSREDEVTEPSVPRPGWRHD